MIISKLRISLNVWSVLKTLNLKIHNFSAAGRFFNKNYVIKYKKIYKINFSLSYSSKKWPMRHIPSIYLAQIDDSDIFGFMYLFPK